MTAILVRVAEAIRKELESITLSQRFTLARSYGDWEDLLEDTERAKLRIDVVPQACPSQLANRGGQLNYEVSTSILLRYLFVSGEHKSGRIENSRIDQLVEDLQTVHQFFTPKRATGFQARKLADVPEAAWSSDSAIKAAFSRKLLKDPGQYSGWCAVIYDVPVEAG